MSLADDDRGRVPFALLGVVLLVGSASYAATLAHRPESADRPDAVAAMNRVDGTVATAVTTGTKQAARAAAQTPLTDPAATPGGDALDDDGTFRDYLRLRVYLAVRTALERSAVSVGDARAVPSLPATPNATALRTALRGVDLARVEGGLRVRLENVTVGLRIDGRLVEQRDRTVVRTVATPILAVHERVRGYEQRLNRDPADGPGLGRRLTVRANAVAWTRGYAQYGGAPIANVVTNRHLEVVTNGALLSTQRTVFGRSDPVGRCATARASVVVGVKDVLNAGHETTETVGRVPISPGAPTHPPPSPPPAVEPPESADRTVTVDVGLAADRAFASFVDGNDSGPLDGVVATAYGADVGLVGASEPVTSTLRPPRRPRGANWTLVDTGSTETVTVHPTSADGPAPRIGSDRHPLQTVTRRVRIEETMVHRWARGDGLDRETRTTRGVRVRTLRVTVAVVGRHAGSSHAPPRPIVPVHERGGPLDGPNLRDVAETASQRVEQRFGPPSALVRRYLAGDASDVRVHVTGERPDGLRDWLVRDLAALRDRVRALSVTVPRTDLGAGEVNPAAELAALLRNRSVSFGSAPTTYDGVAEKARVAARRAYIERVLDRLDRRAREVRATRSKFDGLLADAGVDPRTLDAVLHAGATTTTTPAHPVATGGPLGPLNATVSAAPAYLPTAAVTAERVRAVPAGERYHALAVRNRNLFTMPYADAADGVVGHLLDGERTNLRTAALTLRSVNRTLARRHDGSLARRREALRAAVQRSLTFIRERLRASLASVEGLHRGERAAAVADGFDRWETVDGRAIAAANGSLATAVARAAERRLDSPSEARGDLLAARLRAALAAARERTPARPRQAVVHPAAETARAVTTEVVQTAITRGADASASAVRERLDGKVVRPPSGLPLVPVPGYWYATTNVWTVTVRGEYLRFAVSVPVGPPGQDLTYVRERGVVALDWDLDGESERLGRSTRLSFDVATAVIVVVPPGGPGVGDRDGNADERSAGWPSPGNASTEVTTTSTRGS